MKIANYKNVDAQKVSYVPVTDVEVEAELAKIVEENKEAVEKEGKSELGDITNINFEGFLDGVAFEGGKGENYDLTLGSGSFIPGFEDQLVGYEKGSDVEVNVTFPENYQAANLAGKAVVFKCKINAIKTMVTPEINDDLAKKYGLNTVAEMKEVLAREMNAKKEDEVLNAYLDRLCKILVANSEIEVTDEAKEAKVNEMVAYYDRSMMQYGTNLEGYLQMTGTTMETFKAQMLEQAMSTIKTEILLDEIAKAENLVATDEEVSNEIEMYKNYYKLDEEKLAKFKEEKINDVKANIVRRKVSLFLIENNK